MQALHSVQDQLHHLFNFYVNEQDISNADEIGASYSELVHARHQMPLVAFMRLMQVRP